MTDSEKASIAADEAAQWYARLHAPDCSDADRQAFADWRADNRNERAWNRIAQADQILGSLSGNAAMADLVRDARAMPPVSSPVPSAISSEPDLDRSNCAAAAAAARRQLGLWKYGIAASLMLALGLGSMAAWKGMAGPGIVGAEVADGTRYETATGERRTFALSDGSVVTLDTDSAIAVPQWTDQGRRLVTVEKGQAFFKVAKDAKRPFIVASGERSVEALGTAFTVRHADHGYAVALLEGRVKVDLGSSSNARNAVLEPGDTLLLTGNTVSIRHGLAAKKAEWLEGRLTFEDRPLALVVAEMNRYSTRKIVLADTSLQNRPFSGTFSLDGGDGLVQALDAYGIAKVTHEDAKRIVLAPR